MCEIIRETKPISPQGLARKAQLEASVKADLESGDTLLKTSGRTWRNDMVRRLTPRIVAPQLCRIPNVFVVHLGLKSQRVLLLRSGAVVEVLEYDRSKGVLVTGKTILAPN